MSTKNFTAENGYTRGRRIQLEDGEWTVICWLAKGVLVRDVRGNEALRRWVTHEEFANAK